MVEQPRDGWTGLLAGGPLAALRYLDDCSADALARASESYPFRSELARLCRDLADRAHRCGDRDALSELHGCLELVYRRDFSPVAVTDIAHERQPILRDVAALLEQAVLDQECSRIPEEALADLPLSGGEFIRRLKAAVGMHPAAWHPLYHEHLAERGGREDLRLLLAQGADPDPRLGDLLTAVQLGRTGGEKSEITCHVRDEPGRGDPAPGAVGADLGAGRRPTLLEAGVSRNLSACLALSRRHYYKAVGYFTVTAYLAPRRARCVAECRRRNGLDTAGAAVHDGRPTGADAGRAVGWFKNVVGPLVDADPRAGREIATGAMIRLNTSADCLDALLDRMPAGPAGGASGHRADEDE
ncbi:iron-containing redox enzyme family protein [Kitasatospora sp. NPDC059571]|uniref:iron-containing redox enzyme family protein n=1 Tax=Kitasatospora sp. NPDC059571 TaxID=3346871 RepID=UPI0036CDF823